MVMSMSLMKSSCFDPEVFLMAPLSVNLSRAVHNFFERIFPFLATSSKSNINADVFAIQTAHGLVFQCQTRGPPAGGTTCAQMSLECTLSRYFSRHSRISEGVTFGSATTLCLDFSSNSFCLVLVFIYI